ncbi:MAG: T9SS type A sorting domain-containing protein, partial [Paludibacteraceae bacterium]|nr:T9SS type A sorting domain-containing protein [Paludibacteraceae bacterium]
TSTEGVLNVQLISLMGNVVAEESLRSGDSIDLSHLDKGVYMLWVKSADGFAIAKIVKR